MNEVNDGNAILDPVNTTRGQYAGFWVRFFAYIIDVIIEFIIAMVVILPLIFLTYSSLSKIAFTIVVSIIAVGTFWLYEALFLSSGRMATPGKMAVGIRVTDMNGNRISFGRATVRFAIKGGLEIFKDIPCLNWFCLICFISPFLIPFTEKKQAIHDIIAETIVVCV